MGVVVYYVTYFLRVANVTMNRSTLLNSYNVTTLRRMRVIYRAVWHRVWSSEVTHRPWIEADWGSRGRIFCRPTVRSTLVPAGLSTAPAGYALSSGCSIPRQQQKGNGVGGLFPWRSFLGRLRLIRCTVTRHNRSCSTAACPYTSSITVQATTCPLDLDPFEHVCMPCTYTSSNIAQQTPYTSETRYCIEYLSCCEY